MGDAKASVKDQENVLRTADQKVDDHTMAVLTTCDAKAGIHIKVWDGEKCEGDVEQEYTAKWGKCTKFDDEYYKITGAAALQAAAVAVVAFAGSQF